MLKILEVYVFIPFQYYLKQVMHIQQYINKVQKMHSFTNHKSHKIKLPQIYVIIKAYSLSQILSKT